MFWYALRIFAIRKMDESNCIKFSVKNGIDYAETFDILTVGFSRSINSRTQIQLLYNRFKEGRDDVNDVTCPGHPSTLTTAESTEAVKKMVLNNRRIADDC